MSRILLVEDTASLANVYAAHLKKEGMAVEIVGSLGAARDRLAAEAYGVVLLDLMLPDGNGLDLLRESTRDRLPGSVVVITANGSISTAVEAMRLGAVDFLVKPFTRERLITTVTNALNREVLAGEVARLSDAIGHERFHGFIGSSAPMRAVYATIESVARSRASIFITGESGTGKELCAEALHRASPRAAGPFIPVNCGAIPHDLMESELFGHLKGSFTGAIADKQGAAAAADGGTLFLDEICEMDLDLQTKLLRFLQTQTIQPVGATRPQKVDIRIVAATNRDPLTEVEAGRFRADLFYRLHVVPIELPPLRARDADALLIAEDLLARFAAEEGKGFQGFAEDAALAVLAYPWPGNVRELENVIRNVVLLHDAVEVSAAMLPTHVQDGRAPGGMVAGRAGQAGAPLPGGPERGHERGPVGAAGIDVRVGMRLADIEREAIEATILACRGSLPRAAGMLGVSPSTLYRKREAWAAADVPDPGGTDRPASPAG